MGVGTLLRFAEAVLSLDLNMVEPLLEGEADHLRALRLRRSIGDQCQTNTQLFEAIERFVSAGKHAQLGLVELVEAIGDRVAHLAWRNRPAGRTREPRESLRNDMPPCRTDTGAPVLVPCRVGPQVPRISLDRGDDIVRRMGASCSTKAATTRRHWPSAWPNAARI